MVNFGFMFGERDKKEIEASLEVLIKSIHDKNIEELDINNNEFEPGYVPAFMALVRFSTSLQWLDLSSCYIGAEGT
jgi:Ran GTPase-activating protein (RanGAP) involved in mRNA processing and transport